MKLLLPTLLVLLLTISVTAPASAQAQLLNEGGNPDVAQAKETLGWQAFSRDKIQAASGKVLLVILISIAVGAVLAYHPCHVGRDASLEEMDQPKIIITYTLIGGLAGLMVAVDGALAFAIFGIGGLMRFRTDVGAARETGRVILATILGIFCGLELWLVVVFGVVVAWLLILILDWRAGYRMQVRGLTPELVGESAAAYMAVLQEFPFALRKVRRNPEKKQFYVVFKASRRLDKDVLEEAFADEIEERLRGTVDWPEEG